MSKSTVAPMWAEQSLDFDYKHSTGSTIGRFLAGLKEQKQIWGQRAAPQGVVVPPLGYCEVDGSPTSEWVALPDTGTVTAVATVENAPEGLYPFPTPFAYVLVKLDGADTAMAHVVRDRVADLRVGSKVQAKWAADDQRTGSILDIECFRLVE
jgi:uncharacterized OB-fold protein